MPDKAVKTPIRMGAGGAAAATLEMANATVADAASNCPNLLDGTGAGIRCFVLEVFHRHARDTRLPRQVDLTPA